MLFSVIIPAYNCENTLKSAVESLIMSGIYDYEIIIVNDGSTDNTQNAAEVLSREHTEIKCITKRNGGASSARNRGIDEAVGEYVGFMDADDEISPGSLEKICADVEKTKPDMAVFGMSFDYYHNGRMYRRERLVPPIEGTLSPEQMKKNFRTLYDCNALTPVWNKLIRRETLLKSGTRFRENMILMEDYLFVLECLAHCEKTEVFAADVYRYRQSEDEKGAYRRLCKIPDLAEYMKPFEDSLSALGISQNEAAGLYKMLLGQKLYYAPYGKVREILAQHEKSRYAFVHMGSPLENYLRHKKTQLRHKIAVAVKSSALYRHAKGAEK